MSWIKVKDGLPETGKDVLAAIDYNHYIVAFYSVDAKRWMTTNGEFELADGFIVAWQRIEKYTDDE